ncbi:MAG: 2-hydroxyacyl-CoA dehydratase family protein [Actinobacteria bacterium]|nr:2-hydroxyacyl-CoA dehydratase family protein [Actinomycetota bacterium]
MAEKKLEKLLEQSEVIENEYVKRWKKGGGKVIGYSCVATPVEVIDAAGILPFRLRALGNPNTEIADAHLSRYNCSFCRSCLQLGLDGTYDFLDGLIETNGCDHLRGMFENWQYVKPSPFFHYLKVPHLTNEDALDYFEVEVRMFKEAIEEAFGVEITDGRLRDAIKRQEALRGRLREVFVMRERDDPPFTGAEALSIMLMESAVPYQEYMDMVDGAIEERSGPGISGYRARLMLCGAATDELDLMREIESLGGLVVADAFCYGTKAFWGPLEVVEGEDPIRALSEKYLKDLLCPRMYDDFPRRRDYVSDLVDRASVDGVIVMHNKFCDVHGVDNVQQRISLEKQGTPVLQLEKEYGSRADIGRIKTRVQAFLERIGDRAKVSDKS